MPDDRLHITLHSLGRFMNGVPREVLDLALAAGGAMDYEPFGVSLSLLQSRGGGGAGKLGSVELAAEAGAARELRGFQRALGNIMRRMGFGESQIRSHFHPHMTLHYQHQGIGRTTVAPIAWTAMQFALVDSFYGLGRHEVLACWSLEARQQSFVDW
jgi:RNA 2',3'-cyclic 3'-phosphodiesterase